MLPTPASVHSNSGRLSSSFSSNSLWNLCPCFRFHSDPLFRKTFRKIIRDIQLLLPPKLRHNSLLLLIITFTIFLFIFLSISFFISSSTHSASSFSSSFKNLPLNSPILDPISQSLHLYTPSFTSNDAPSIPITIPNALATNTSNSAVCNCPLVSIAGSASSAGNLRRFENLLANSNLVFTGQLVQILANGRWAQFRITTLYRGLPRLIDYDILVPVYDNLACYSTPQEFTSKHIQYSAELSSENVELNSRNRTYLVVTGKTYKIGSTSTFCAMERQLRHEQESGHWFWRWMSGSFGNSVRSASSFRPNAVEVEANNRQNGRRISESLVRRNAQRKLRLDKDELINCMDESELAILESKRDVFSGVKPLPCGSTLTLWWDGLGVEFIELVQREAVVAQEDWWRHKRKPHAVDVIPPASFRDVLVNMTEVQAVAVMDNIVKAAELSGLDEEWWSSPGISIFAACKDRTDSLMRALPTWLTAKHVDEIIVLDWSSTPSIRDAFARFGGSEFDTILSDPRIRIVRVNGESNWWLSRAYNIAARFTTRTSIFKADCDTILSPTFFDAHKLALGKFYAGDWRSYNVTSTGFVSPDDLHLNGLLYVRRADFFALNGYDERIASYGWDDTDIVKRLINRGLNQDVFDHTLASHSEHSYTKRVVNQKSLISSENPLAAAVEVQRNRLLATKMGISSWNANSQKTHYNVRVVEAFPEDSIVLNAANRILSLPEIVDQEQLEESSKRALRITLKERFGYPSFPRLYSIGFLSLLLDFAAIPESNFRVYFVLETDCVRRFSQYLLIKAALTKLKEQQESVRIHPVILWLKNQNCTVLFHEMIAYLDEEIYELTNDNKQLPDIYAKQLKLDRNTSEFISERQLENVVEIDSSNALFELNGKPGEYKVIRFGDNDENLYADLTESEYALIDSNASMLRPSVELLKSLGSHSLFIVSHNRGGSLVRQSVGKRRRLRMHELTNPVPVDVQQFAFNWKGFFTIDDFISSYNAVKESVDSSLTLYKKLPKACVVLTGILSSNVGRFFGYDESPQ